MKGLHLTAEWIHRAGTLYAIVADRGEERSELLRRQLDRAAVGGRTWFLSCDFDEGGPWAGIRDLLRSVVDELSTCRPEALSRHAYELVHVLPTLRRHVAVRHESLTDVSFGGERVRNFPADRAYRFIHGLVNLLAEAHGASDSPWVMACDALDRSGPIAKRFFQELLRRKGQQLALVILAGIDPACGEEVENDFASVAHVELVRRSCRPGIARDVDPDELERRALELEKRAGDNCEAEELIPDLIHAWRRAGSGSREFYWQVRALELYPRLGFYEDALRYGEAVRGVLARDGNESIQLRWLVFFKVFISLTSTRRPEEALALAEEEARRGPYSDQPANRAQTLYLLAMLHARFLPRRDLALSEELLARGVAEIELIEDPEQRLFSQVFNRNGLALVRNLQGRRDEAIALCREGFERLQAELSAEKHRLHRSVLVYNIAQVYAAMGAHDEALEHYAAVIEMDPHYSEYYNERGNLLLSIGRYREAYDNYKSAIELSPPYPEVYVNLGQCCRLAGLLDEAVEAYSAALDLGPDLLLAYIGRAQAYDLLGREEEALFNYDAAIALEPGSAELLANRAVLRFGGGRLEEALSDLDRAIELAPERSQLYENRAFVYEQLGHRERALTDLRRSLALVLDGDQRLEIEARIRSLESPACGEAGNAATVLAPGNHRPSGSEDRPRACSGKWERRPPPR